MTRTCQILAGSCYEAGYSSLLGKATDFEIESCDEEMD